MGVIKLPGDVKEWVESMVKETKAGCWIWPIQSKRAVYPRARIPLFYQKRYQLVSGIASRSIYAVYNPDKFDPELLVLHTRDCPAKSSFFCVNPDHMYQGTYSDNAMDSFDFGNSLYGDRRSDAKLTDTQVRKIRKLYAKGNSCAAVIKILGLDVSTTAVRYIVTGRTWKRV